MSLMVSTFILILASVVSIFLAQVFSKISVNYISMIIGALIFFIPIMGKNVMTFNSDIFIGLIVAPLLFFEGQVTRLNAVGKELKHIIQTTVFLVVICMILAGFGVWEIAGVSLPLAFILAAISTPTDATAMESVTNGLKMPKNEGTFLKMESLFNDASGIILLNMAILWYINGYINYGETLGDFFISAGGGVLFSFSAAWIMVLFRQILLRSSYNSLNAQSLIYILTPFVLYYAAEEIHVSGIIAVVCAGLVHNAEAQRSRLINAPQVHLGFDLVSMITEIFNSTFFVILGYMFTKIISEEKFTNASLTWIMIGLTLYLVNVLARYLYGRLRLDFNNKSSWIFALGESVLIILSLIVPTIAFRFLLKKDVTDDDAEKEVDKIRVEMVHRAIDSVNKMYLPDNVKKSVIFDLMAQKQRTRTRAFVKAWVDVVRHPEFTGAEKELEMRAFMNAFVQEREYLDMISQSEIKYQNYVFELYNEILLAETLVIGPTVSEDEE
ncbi:cation:proton antiporter [Companilactobacillus futsaii]|uniref:Sodium:proton antiporter n=2 Tax=Companilactobacillus futsaii TaxID=938155 RepID=A0A5B7T1N0_9LACO|nr:cation:proton antiporter [Companilactobacillus futsaii]KRK95062.1 Na(+) H(+) antiporter [Companilactobacillus futsaii JCM 17355]QCX25738.1 sodium:proton antiporter [Companilactobacillus futsaii]